MDKIAPTNRLLPIPSALAMLGIGRTKLYELLGTGELQAVKIGRRTFIPSQNLEDLLLRLPAYRQLSPDFEVPVNNTIEKEKKS